MERGGKPVQAAAEHLQGTLSKEEPSERDYHIRTALQCCDSIVVDAAEDTEETAS